MGDTMMAARAEAIVEISSDLLKAAGTALARHGNDPHSEVVLCAAVAMFVSRIDEHLLPGFQSKMAAMLGGTP